MIQKDADTEPETIRLLDSTGINVLDSIATEYEDSFCLESFGDSIKSAENCDPKGTKHFIIARVQTWDHKQPDRAFYSYYHAHHLNKLLFQTQVYLDKKLIHRLHVLNPLTNTDIIGNVVYFMVLGKVKKTKEGRIIRLYTDANQSSNVLKTQEISSTTMANAAMAAAAVTPIPTSPSVTNLPQLQDPVVLNRYLHNQDPAGNSVPPTIIEDEEEHKGKDRPLTFHGDISKNGWTLTGSLTGTVSQEEAKTLPTEPVQPPPVPERTSKRMSGVQQFANSISRRLSIGGKKGFVAFDEETGAGKGNVTSGGDIRMDNTKARMRPAGLKVSTNFVPYGSGAQSAGIVEGKVPDKFDIVSGGPQSAYPHPIASQFDTSLSPSRIAKVPAGQITLRGEKISPLQAQTLVPPSARSRRRALSYMNSLVTSGSNGATFEDWKNMYTKDKKSPGKERMVDEASGKYDEVKPFGSPLIPESNEDDQNQDEYFYDAILLATDNDFLETSRIRAIFKENSVNPSDCTLFEMPPYTGEPNQGPYDLEDIPLPCDCLFPSEQQLRNSPAWVRLMHECKCYLFLLLLTGAIIGFITLIMFGSGDNKNSK